MAKPTRAASSPPGYLWASSANTGSTRNKPNMRNAKINANAALERRSNGVMVVDTRAWEAGEDGEVVTADRAGR
jgi:hypothetical protein